MTKIKNTKKGMAKKTLSMSLVVAMLATSNVPVWAAEFSDGTDVAVTSEAEAPVADTVDEFSDNAAEAPVVADDTTEEVSVAQAAADYKVTTNMELKDVTWAEGLKFGKKDGITEDAEFKVEDKDGLSKDVNKVEIYTDAGLVKTVTVSAGQKVADVLEKTVLDVDIYKTSTSKKFYAKFYVDGENEAVYTTNEATVKPVSIDKTWSITVSNDTVTYNGKKQSPEITVKKGNVTASVVVKFAKVTEAQNVGEYKYYAEGVEADGFVGTTHDDATDKTFTINPVTPSEENLSVVISGNATYNGKNAQPKVVLTDKLTNTVIPEELYTVKVNDDATAVGSYTKDNLTITLNKEAVIGTDTKATKNNFSRVDAKNNIINVAAFATGDYKIDALDLSKLGDTYTITMDARTVADGAPTLADVKFVDKKTGKTVVYTDVLPYNATSSKSDIQYSVSGADKVGTGTLTIEPTAAAKTAGNVIGSYSVNFSVVSGVITKSAVALPAKTKIGTNDAFTEKKALNDNIVESQIAGVLGTAQNPAVPYNSTAIEPLKDVFSKLELTVQTPTVTPETLTLGTDYDITYSDNTDSYAVSGKKSTITLTFKGKYTGKIEYDFYIKQAEVNVAAKKIEYTAGKTSYDAAAEVYTLDSNNKKVAVPEKDYTITTTEKATLNSKTAKGVVRFENKNYKIVSAKDSDGTSVKPGTSDDYYYATIKSSVVEKDISKCTATVEGSYVYTGEAISPKLVVKDGDVTLKEGTDYTIISTAGANAGEAIVTIKGAGWYKGTLDVKYTIAKANLANATVLDASKKKDFKISYNGYPVVDVDKVVGSVKIGNTELKKYDPATKTGDYVITLDDDATNVGTYNFTIKAAPGNSRVEGEYKGTFTIVASEQKGSFATKVNNTKVTAGTILSVDVTGAYYTGQAITIDSFKTKYVVVDNNNKVLTEGKDYELRYTNNVNAGIATVEAFGLGNHKYVNPATGKETAFATLQYCIAAKDVITSDMIKKVNDVEYAGGLPVEPQVVILDAKGNRLTQGVDYTVETSITDVTADVDGNGKIDKNELLSGSKVTIKGKGAYVVGFIGLNGKVTPKYAKDSYISALSGLTWKVTKKDLANTTISIDKNNNVTVMNGSVVVPSSEYDVKFSEDGKKVTVTAKADSKNYVGSKELAAEVAKVGAPIISSVKVTGNKATVILSDEAEGASGYDYVISTSKDPSDKDARIDVVKNQVQTTANFKYVTQGTYYAYCHAWTRDENGKKVFGEWSNSYPFSVTAITPDTPEILSVKTKGSTITVTYKESANSTGYDVVLGKGSKKEHGETRPYQYGKYKKLNVKPGVCKAVFKNIPAGTYYAGVHSWNRTASENDNKVFSKWSNLETAKVK